ncbi:MAG: polyprenyl synthetase family protein, partial [Acidobacteriota bacterium]
QVAEGKTASVFRWALEAGGVAGGLERAHTGALAEFGQQLGITFQAVDDLLDLTGDPDTTGKDLFTDLREGKMTLPLIFALERDAEARDIVGRVLDVPEDEAVPRALARQVIDVLRRTDAVADTLTLARQHSRRAIDALDTVPDGDARRALATVAEAIVDRDL